MRENVFISYYCTLQVLFCCNFSKPYLPYSILILSIVLLTGILSHLKKGLELGVGIFLVIISLINKLSLKMNSNHLLVAGILDILLIIIWSSDLVFSCKTFNIKFLKNKSYLNFKTNMITEYACFGLAFCTYLMASIAKSNSYYLDSKYSCGNLLSALIFSRIPQVVFSYINEDLMIYLGKILPFCSLILEYFITIITFYLGFHFLKFYKIGHLGDNFRNFITKGLLIIPFIFHLLFIIAKDAFNIYSFGLIMLCLFSGAFSSALNYTYGRFFRYIGIISILLMFFMRDKDISKYYSLIKGIENNYLARDIPPYGLYYTGRLWYIAGTIPFFISLNKKKRNQNEENQQETDFTSLPNEKRMF